MNSRPSGSSDLGQLLGHRPVHAAVEIEADVHARRLRRLDPGDDLVERFGRADPVELGGGVHLDRREALSRPRLGRFADLVRPVAADPGVSADPVADLAAHQLPRRLAERAALQIPQSLVEAGQRAHQHRAAAIEAAAISDLPDILDGEGVVADEPVAQRLEGAVDRFRPAFEAGLAPADRAVVALDPDEQPAGRREECLDAADLHTKPPSDPCQSRSISSFFSLSLAASSCSRASARPWCAGDTIGTTRHRLDAGSTSRQSLISF